MRLTRQRVRIIQPDLDMASMLDVVFLLLIYFLVTSSFTPREKDLDSQLPRIGGHQQSGITDYDPIRIDIIGHAETVEIQCDGQRCATYADLKSMLAQRRAIDDIPVIIYGDQGVHFQRMVDAMNACYESGLQRVAFAPAE